MCCYKSDISDSTRSLNAIVHITTALITEFDEKGVIVAGFKRHSDTGALLPAEASGRLSVGDVVCAVDGHNLDGLSAEAAAVAIREARQRGRSDSMLLTVRPQGAAASSGVSAAAAAAAEQTVSPVPNVPQSGFTSPAPASVSHQ
jgi:PDZ domain